MEKNKDSLFEVTHSPNNSNAIVIKEEKKYVLRRGIFGIAFLVEENNKIEIKIEEDKDKKTSKIAEVKDNIWYDNN